MLARAIAAAIGRYYSDALHYESVKALRAAYAPPCDPARSTVPDPPSDPSDAR